MQTNILNKLCAMSLLSGLILFCGCVSKREAELRAQQAYITGQQQAMAKMQAHPNSVRVRGHVKNEFVSWKEGMTLVHAIVAADYLDRKDPREIIVTRNEEVFKFSAAELYQGSDIPVQPGDVIELR